MQQDLTALSQNDSQHSLPMAQAEPWHTYTVAAVLEIAADALHSRLDFENILAGLDQQYIHAAFDQPLRLFVENIRKLRERNV